MGTRVAVRFLISVALLTASRLLWPVPLAGWRAQLGLFALLLGGFAMTEAIREINKRRRS